MPDTLYKRLGGYDGIATVCNDLLTRLQADPQLARFWLHRSEDSLQSEKQALINFICSSAGGPLYYTGRDMKLSHRGLRIDESDWQTFLNHLGATLAQFEVPSTERNEVLKFVDSTKAEIVE
jgi:hemoglobin